MSFYVVVIELHGQESLESADQMARALVRLAETEGGASLLWVGESSMREGTGRAVLDDGGPE